MITWLKNHLKKIVVVLAALLIFSFILMFWFPVARAFNIVFGSVGVLFLPGFFFTFIFFPASRSLQDPVKASSLEARALDGIERIVLSIIFSITLITLTFTFLRRLDVNLTPLKVALVVIFFNIVNMAGALLVSRWQREKGETKGKNISKKVQKIIKRFVDFWGRYLD